MIKSVVENKKMRSKEDKKSLNQKILILKLNRSGKRALLIVNRDHKSSPDLEKVAPILMKSTPLS